MAYLGLVPTENTSSDKRRQGRITKCGNAHARWLLVSVRSITQRRLKYPRTSAGASKLNQSKCVPSAGARNIVCTGVTPGC
jgi:transposase